MRPAWTIRRRATKLLVAVGAGGLALSIAVGLVVMLAGGTARGAAVVVAVALALGLSAALAAASWHLARRRGLAGGHRARALELSCGRCGAPNALVVGRALQACGHCGAALFPGADARSVALDRAAEARWHAARERYARERALTPAPSDGHFWTAPVALFAVTALLGGLILAALAVRGASLGAYLGWVASMVVVIAGCSAFTRYLLRSRDAYRRAQAELARAVQGVMTDRYEHVSTWLERLWAAPVPPLWLCHSWAYGAVVTERHGLPVLLETEPEGYGAKGTRRPARLTVLVSAVLQREAPASASAAEHALGQIGFRVHLAPMGLLAEAEAGVVERFGRDPDVVRDAARAAELLVRLARERGGRPPPAAGQARWSAEPRTE